VRRVLAYPLAVSLIAASIALLVLRARGLILVFPVVDAATLLASLTLMGLGLVIIGVRGYRAATALSDLEAQLPLVIRMLVDAHNAGLDIYSGFRLVAESGVEPMSSVARRLMYLVEVSGLSIDRALTVLAREYRRSILVSRFALILSEAARGGARLAEVLDAMSRVFAAAAEYSKEKAAALRPYIATFLFMIMVYVVIADIFVYFLMPNMAGFARTPSARAPVMPAISIVLPSLEEALSMVSYLGIVEALLGGLIIGRIVFNDARPGLLIGGISIIIIGVGLYIPSLIHLA